MTFAPSFISAPDFGGWCQVTLALITLGAGAGEPSSMTHDTVSGNVSRRQMSEPESVCHMPETRDRDTRLGDKSCKQIMCTFWK